MFFIAYTFKGHVHAFAGRVKVVSHSSCRTSAILKYFCPLLCKVSFSTKCFSVKYWTGHRCFIHKLELYCVLASKKISIPNWHLFITQIETKWTKWYAMTSHVIAFRSLELLFYTHTFHFNCFFEDFNCVFTQICCLSRVLKTDGF